MRLVRHRGKWALSIGGRRFSTGVSAERGSLETAERKAREIASRLIAESYGTSVAEIIRAYKDDIPNRLEKVVNPERIGYAEKALIPFFGGMKPDDVTVFECRAYVGKRREAGAPGETLDREEAERIRHFDRRANAYPAGAGK